PHLAIEPYVKGICDLRNLEYRPYLSKQFSISYDVYLQIQNQIRIRVAKTLGRDQGNWRLQNACPPCTYRLKEEPPLDFSMLVTMD
ncbi:hypothetical protein P691DRAFT_616513, partial [Macrolepiota fuliginosa MF-IS2]